MDFRRVHTAVALFLAALAVAPGISLRAVTTAPRAGARSAYARALRLRAALEARPEKARTKAEYANVIAAFHKVYELNPASTKAPISLSAVAELYEEMGHVFSNARYYSSSIKAYEFEIAQYPRSSVSRDSLYTVAEIYRTGLNDREGARKTFRMYVERYPKSANASAALRELEEMSQPLTAPGAYRDGTGPAAEIPAPPQASSAEAPGEAENGPANRTGQVTSIRHWVGPNYTRIVIAVDNEVPFDAHRLKSPDRLVFDLSNVRPGPALLKTFPVEDGFLRQVRVAQFTPSVTRVVLDVEQIEDYSVFSLPNPFRLVIDIHGPPRSMAAKDETAKSARAAASASPPASESLPTSKTARPDEARNRGLATSGASHPLDETQKPARAETKGETASAEIPSKTGGGTETTSLSPKTSLPIAPASPTESGSRTLTRALGLKIGRIVIDPGHGGHDTGTIGPAGLSEKDVVLDVALRLAKRLEEDAGSEVVLTRHDDTFIPLEERTAIANEKAADLFISIHANASRDRQARGIETYYLNFTSSPDALEVAARENATSQESVHQLTDLIKKIALTEKIEESQEFAVQVQREVHARLVKAQAKQKDRGVKKAPFVVLIGANMPSVLAEISFLSNPTDEALLRRPEYRQKIAQALYEGIARYIKNFGGIRVAQRARLPARSEGSGPGAEASLREAAPASPPNF